MRQTIFYATTLLSLTAHAVYATNLHDPVAKTSNVVTKTLESPISVVVDPSHRIQALCVQAFCDTELLIKKETSLSSSEEVKEFLQSCAEEIFDTGKDPTSIQVFALGKGFSDLEKKVEECFSDLSFSQKQERSSISLIRKGEEDEAFVTFEFLPNKTTLESQADIKEFWTTKAIESILVKKMPSSSSFYSTLSSSLEKRQMSFACSFTASCPQQYALETLEELLAQLSQVNEISQEDLSSAQASLLSYLQTLQEEVSALNPSTLFSLRSGLLKMKNPQASLSDFFTSSKELLSQITLEELQQNLSNLIQESQRYIVVESPIFSTLVEDNVIATVENHKNPLQKTDKTSSGSGPILSSETGIKVERSDPFERNLSLSDNEKKLITEIISTTANGNFMHLIAKQAEMKQKGDRINPVHPLRFLSVVFSSPELTRDIRKIRDSGLKWDGFLTGKLSGREGIAQRLTLEYHNDNLFEYIPGFCKFLKLSSSEEAKVKEYCNRRDWSGLITYLIEIKNS